VSITAFVDTSRPYFANDHVRLGAKNPLRKAALGGGILFNALLLQVKQHLVLAIAMDAEV
jgi:hypothetical protein